MLQACFISARSSHTHQPRPSPALRLLLREDQECWIATTPDNIPQSTVFRLSTVQWPPWEDTRKSMVFLVPQWPPPRECASVPRPMEDFLDNLPK